MWACVLFDAVAFSSQAEPGRCADRPQLCGSHLISGISTAPAAPASWKAQAFIHMFCSCVCMCFLLFLLLSSLNLVQVLDRPISGAGVGRAAMSYLMVTFSLGSIWVWVVTRSHPIWPGCILAARCYQACLQFKGIKVEKLSGQNTSKMPHTDFTCFLHRRWVAFLKTSTDTANCSELNCHDILVPPPTFCIELEEQKHVLGLSKYSSLSWWYWEIWHFPFS